MVGNLKALGLAFVAVLAMSVVAASASQASQYTCSAYAPTAPCFGTGSNTPGNETLTTPGGTVQCNSHYTVEEAGGSEEGLEGPKTSVTVTPTYTDCKAFGFLNASIDMMGCDYVFHAEAQIAAGRYNNSVDVTCPVGKGPVTLTVGTCKVDIPAQGPLTNVETENLAGGTLTVKPNVANITLNVTTDGFGCPFPSTGHFTGSFHGDVTISRVGGGTISVSGV